MARTWALIAPVQPILHRVSCSNERLPNAPKHYETHKNRSLGSIGCMVHHCENFQCDFMPRTCALILPFQPTLHRISCSNETIQKLPNTTKHTKTRVYGPMGWFGCVRCQKLWCDFMAQTCALIASVQPILHQVSSSNETLPNAPKHFETHKNRSLGPVWLDRVRSLRKIPMRLHATNLYIKSTISADFVSSFAQ